MLRGCTGRTRSSPTQSRAAVRAVLDATRAANSARERVCVLRVCVCVCVCVYFRSSSSAAPAMRLRPLSAKGGSALPPKEFWKTRVPASLPIPTRFSINRKRRKGASRFGIKSMRFKLTHRRLFARRRGFSLSCQCSSDSDNVRRASSCFALSTLLQFINLDRYPVREIIGEFYGKFYISPCTIAIINPPRARFGRGIKIDFR